MIEIYHIAPEETMKKLRQINYMGFLSLLALIPVICWKTGNHGLWGFFGYLYYLKYFWVIPDEMFILQVQKAATISCLTGIISLVPLMVLCSFFFQGREAVSVPIGLSFAVIVFLFGTSFAIFEAKGEISGND